MSEYLKDLLKFDSRNGLVTFNKIMISGRHPTIELPNHWYILSEYDKYQYNYTRALMSSPSNKNQRNKRIETFSEALDAIKAYAIRGDGEDWRRCLVCGIFWLPEGIAINTRQLRLLIFKCKSSINGSLQKMGFNTNVSRTEAANIMINALPMLKDNTSELRQWTVRQQGSKIDTIRNDIVSSPEVETTTSSPSVMMETSYDYTIACNEDTVKQNPWEDDGFSLEIEVPMW